MIFGILIVVFVISFGPQSVARRGGIRGGGGCGAATPAAASVNGAEISENSWRYGILAMGAGSATSERARRMQIRERVLDLLIVRELLAQKAEDMGLRISDAEVRDRLTSGELHILGMKQDGKRAYFVKEEGDDQPRFMAKALDAFAKNSLGLPTVDKLIEEQKRELLAVKLRELVAASARVSPEEVQARYQLENTKVSIEYVPFSAAVAKSRIELVAGDIDGYLKQHEAELREQYDKEADRWKGRDKEVRVRDLFVRTERPASQPSSQPASQPAAPDPARAKAEAAMAKLKAGQDLAAIVKAANPDAPRAGDLGWRPLRGLRLGAPVADAVGKLERGQNTGIVDVPDGYHIVQLLDKREGDLSFDQVKRDMAEDALRDERAKAEVKAEAEKAYAAAKEGKPLDKQFPGEESRTPGPKLMKANDIARAGGFVPGIGSSEEILKALFEEMKPGDLGPKVYAVGDDQFIVRLVKRDEPDMQKFQTEKEKLAAQMAKVRGEVAVSELATSECRRARDHGAINYDPSLVAYDVETRVKPSYEPCATLR